MTDTNHRRGNRPPVNQRHGRNNYHNGYVWPDNKETGISQRVGKTDFLDKSLHGFSRKSKLGDVIISARIGNDFCNGHRGMAKAVRGAKKFVRTRIRFHEKAMTKRLLKEIVDL